MIVKPFLAGLLLGLLFGFVTGWSVNSWNRDAQVLRQTNTNLRELGTETTRRSEIAQAHEQARETIERETEAASDDLDAYLQSRADVRAFDLGPEWLCITDRAAGIATPRCASEPASRVPGAGLASDGEIAGHAAQLRARDPVVSDLPGTPSRPGERGNQAKDQD